jgi:hypothetical protein
MPAAHPDLSRFRSKRRPERLQFVERRGIVANTVWSGDVDLPSLIEQGTPFGDGDGGTQADGDLDIFAF